jgi:hypothetical protein
MENSQWLMVKDILDDPGSRRDASEEMFCLYLYYMDCQMELDNAEMAIEMFLQSLTENSSPA